MNHPSNAEQESREIARLTRIYAQNRSLGVVVNLLVFVVFSAGLFILSSVGGMAYRSGNRVLLWACIVLLAFVLSALVYLSIPRWGGHLLERLVGHLYREGSVSIAMTQRPSRRRTGIALAVAYGVCIVGSVLLGVLGFIPEQYMQPVSAVYAVPFLIALIVLMRPVVSYVLLLWPVLYALHAVLIVAGVPIVFTGRWEFFNMLIPVAGYGLIAALTSHVYNRLALHKLRRLAQNDAAAADETNGVRTNDE